VDAFTSGFEGPWTSNPTSFDNGYFKSLLAHDWEPALGPGGHYQWSVAGGGGPVAPSADAWTASGANGTQRVMMLTSDVSLLHDAAYRALVADYANDEALFGAAFAAAWYKLTTRDMGPWARCQGDAVPPPQPWQLPLPSPAATLADFGAVADALALSFITPQVKRERSESAATPLVARPTDEHTYTRGCESATGFSKKNRNAQNTSKTVA
jgi:catalase (peroxidase I)